MEKIYKSRFFIGDYTASDIKGTTFEGYQFEGDYWNGWNTPFFTKKEGLRLCEFQNQTSIRDYNHWGFDQVKDSFFYVSYHGEFPEIQEFRKVRINGKIFYVIGECFCWQDIRESRKSAKL